MANQSIPMSGHGAAARHPIADDGKHQALRDPKTHLALETLLREKVFPDLFAHSSPSSLADYDLTPQDIATLCDLILRSDLAQASKFITLLQDRGLRADAVFTDLLAQVAFLLGERWTSDECSFLEVTLALGELQKLLKLFSCEANLSSPGRHCKMVLTGVPGDQHSFGLSMVDKFMHANGWEVRNGPFKSARDVESLVRREWFAGLGLSMTADGQVDRIQDLIQLVRRASRNKTIWVLLGGDWAMRHPEQARMIGADAIAKNAPEAVILAQRLTDEALRAAAV